MSVTYINKLHSTSNNIKIRNSSLSEHAHVILWAESSVKLNLHASQNLENRKNCDYPPKFRYRGLFLGTYIYTSIYKYFL